MIRATRATCAGILVAVVACGGNHDAADDEQEPDARPPVLDAPPPTVLSGDIAANLTLLARHVYVLRAIPPVVVEPGVTLTIERGAEIRGEQGALLVVARGARINAVGTAEEPIVFTSSQPAGARTPGWWGGVLILGNAPINVNVGATPPSNQASFNAFAGTPPKSWFGGDDPHDNSGTLVYVRIEFAGNIYANDRDLNGLTLAGIGDGTTIDFVQVHGGANDGIQLVGGTVGLRHIVASQNWDDGIDIDNGWQGKAQFIVVQDVSHPTTLPEATDGYESDNHGLIASYMVQPVTLPTISHVTLIGDHAYTGAPHFAAVFRRNTGGHYANHIWYGFRTGLEVRDQPTLAQIADGNLEVRDSMLFMNDAPGAHQDLLFTATNHDTLDIDPGLPAAVTSRTAPDFKLLAGATALTGGVPPTDSFFDQTATFRGAIGTVDWTAGWTAYPQN
jgi:hypothetical protein